ADQRDGRQVAAPLAPGPRSALDLAELAAQLGDAIADPAAIELERGLARALAADAAAHAVAAAAALAQPPREVLEPRDLDLQPRLARPRVAVEDLEDHRRAIEDIGAGGALEVALLGRREVVIDEHDLGARRCVGVGRRAVAAVLIAGVLVAGIPGGVAPGVL